MNIDPWARGELTYETVVETSGGDARTDNDRRDATQNVAAAVDLIVAIESEQVATAGSDIELVATVSNRGPSASLGATVTFESGIELTSPDGRCVSAEDAWSCRVSVDPDAETLLDVVATVPAGQREAIRVDMGASSDETELAPDDNVSAYQATPELDVSLAVSWPDAPDTAVAGAGIRLPFAWSNSGRSTVNDATVRFRLAAGVEFVGVEGFDTTCQVEEDRVSCPVGEVASDTEGSAELSVRVSATARGELIASGRITAEEGESVWTDHTIQVETEVDLAVAADLAGAITAGSPSTITIEVANVGRTAATDVELAYVLPEKATFISAVPDRGSCENGETELRCDLLSMGADSNTSIEVVFAMAADARGDAVSELAVSGSETDSSPSNNTARRADPIGVSIDLSIAMTATPEETTSGGLLLYTLRAANSGPSVATDVVLTGLFDEQLLPETIEYEVASCFLEEELDCHLTSLAPGQLLSVEVWLRIPRSVSGDITATGRIAGLGVDTEEANNVATVVVSVTETEDPVACSGFDSDGDGVPDDCDNCPDVQNSDQGDEDEDGEGDVCDSCAQVADQQVADSDDDSIGDDCDVCPMDGRNDEDGDGLCADEDNCPFDDNPEQIDSDGDGLGDACDVCFEDTPDQDGDGICDAVDQCPETPNPEGGDLDGDRIGDACDECPADRENDADGDGVCGNEDNCPYVENADQADEDEDGVGDACSSCPEGAEDCDIDTTPPDDDPPDLTSGELDTDPTAEGCGCAATSSSGTRSYLLPWLAFALLIGRRRYRKHSGG